MIAANGAIVLFGGIGAAGVLDDTWTWNGAAWTAVSGSARPARARLRRPTATRR